MASYNQVIAIGRLGADPDLKELGGGNFVCKFSIAVTEKRKDKDGELRERTDWINVVAWGRLAWACNEYLRKGRLVFIEGKLQSRSYLDRDGVKKYITEVSAHRAEFLTERGAEALAEQNDFTVPVNIDDIPF